MLLGRPTSPIEKYNIFWNILGSGGPSQFLAMAVAKAKTGLGYISVESRSLNLFEIQAQVSDA